ncbi:MAG: urease accessory protein UreE [Tepidimonas ignava]|uniref:Urease accessory protein UreE n=2 Tax=Tepidimonas ignava TaxID=114249 RepID=A0A4R3L8L6_9BURK|nr:urease accessory protein UreE [Tepidimonas ignava]MCX7814197.1 urease accessory protein UreE [Tepidimonas ignava]TCS94564.1 urease accessory protein [Tepidimonas ignava]TSE18796.1 Urease accessory protein UreE [Tepidimonas ignava]
MHHAAAPADPPLLASRLIPGGAGLARTLLARAPVLELEWTWRQRSRFEARDSQGRRIAVLLPRGSVMRDGDVLVLTDGGLLCVRAAVEPLLKVTTCAEHGTPLDLLRAAYHLGNRHVALQLHADHLKLERDHVLADLLRQMHLTVTEVEEPFEPEFGAYGGPAHHRHDGHVHPTDDHPHHGQP